VTRLRKMMLEELQRRNYSQATVRSYLHAVQAFAEHFNTPPDRLGREHIRIWQAHLFQEKKLSANTVSQMTAALRFFFVRTLRRPYLVDEVPYPKTPHRLPSVLTREEAALLINSASNLFHRAILMTLYATGMRRAEVCHLKVGDIDKAQMVVHVRSGKGDRDRDIPLDPKLRETLQEYWRWMRPKTWLFPGTIKGWRADKPIDTKVVWQACRQAARRAGITKPAAPHALRHAFATHRLESGCDLVTLKTLLGHANIRHTEVYLHLSQNHLRSAGNPLDNIDVSGPGEIRRSRKLIKK
jgi:integrase/recombinase XerD